MWQQRGTRELFCLPPASYRRPNREGTAPVPSRTELNQEVAGEESLAEILSIAGHELSQPLMVALAAAHLLERPQPEDQREVFHSMLVRNLHQLQQLIDDFEVMGNPELLNDTETHPMARRMEPLSLAEVLESAARDFESTWSGCSIVVRCEGRLDAMVDPFRFRQVLSNLMTNAEKFGALGSQITITGRLVGDDILISFHNEGEGFPVDRADDIFDKSIRLGGVVRGRGWGLYVARAIIVAHSGRLWAESDPGRGATFFIRLPGIHE
jgi:signal transduction histidine kinase